MIFLCKKKKKEKKYKVADVTRCWAKGVTHARRDAGLFSHNYVDSQWSRCA